jgi:hypothetical protein
MLSCRPHYIVGDENDATPYRLLRSDFWPGARAIIDKHSELVGLTLGQPQLPGPEQSDAGFYRRQSTSAYQITMMACSAAAASIAISVSVRAGRAG